jgi:hypothetical protein
MVNSVDLMVSLDQVRNYKIMINHLVELTTIVNMN